MDLPLQSEDNSQQFQRRRLLPQIIPAIILVASVFHAHTAILYRSKVKIINDQPEFSDFKIFQEFSYAFGITMFICGFISTIMMRFQNKFIIIGNIILNILGTLVCLLGMAYAIYILTITKSTIQGYWENNLENNDSVIKELIESTFRCCGYDTISPSKCSCQSPSCYELTCQEGFEVKIQRYDMFIFVSFIIGFVLMAISTLLMSYSFFKKEKKSYFRFQ